MATTVFIDGHTGTSAVQIADRLSSRRDIVLTRLEDSDRKDTAKRREAINDADIAILCLPDDAAREAVNLVSGGARILDASTAHRVAPGWTYGLPEYAPHQPEAISRSNRVSNPGCYPTGAVLLLAPLVRAGILPPDYPVTIFAVSGYSGGGRRMIEQFTRTDGEDRISTAHRAYGLDLEHKHVPEIERYSLLSRRPIFLPSVGRFPQGMVVQIPLHGALLGQAVTIDDVRRSLMDAYAGQTLVVVAGAEECQSRAHVDADTLAGVDSCVLRVSGSDRNGQIVLTAALDNLGKGAAGVAVQNLDLMLSRSAT